MKDLIEEQMINISFAQHGRHSTAPTNYPKVTQYVIQMLHNWLYSGGRAVVYSVDKTLSPLCRSGLAHETKSHCARMRMASILRLNYGLLHHFPRLCACIQLLNSSRTSLGKDVVQQGEPVLIQYPQSSWTEIIWVLTKQDLW